jgi:pilus assembly protein CpaE
VVERAIRALVAVEAPLTAHDIAAALPNDGQVQTIGVVEGMEESWRTLEETSVDLLVVACGGGSERALFLIEGAVRQDPNRPVIVLTQGSPNGFVRRVFEAGADDLIVLPENVDDIRFAILKAVARKQGAGSAAAALGRLVCVLGPKGGTGKTLTSTNLGVALADLGHRTVVVDLDLQFGDIGLSLGLSPTTTVYDLVNAGGSLDAAKVEDFLVRHESGLRALVAPTRPDQASAVTVAFLRDLYPILRASFDFVIVDTPPGFTPEVITTIDASTDLIVVGMLDALSLKNTKLGLETLDIMGVERDKVRLLLNRAQTKVGISDDDVLSVLGGVPDTYVPSDRDIPCALSEGRVIVDAKPNSEAAEAYRKLAKSLAEPREPATAEHSNGQAPPELVAAGGRRIFGRRS